MNKKAIVNIVQGQAKAAGLTVDSNHIDNAVALAAERVWYAYQWEFRRRATTLASGTDEYVELPGDFKSVKSLIYRNGSTEGWQLDFSGEDRYDIDFPNPDLYTADAPRKMKIVQMDGVWRAYFTPQPDASYDLTLVYNAAFGDISMIDSSLSHLVATAAWTFIHPAGKMEWIGAERAYQEALIRAIDSDAPAQVSVGIVKRGRRFNVVDSGEVKDDWYLDNTGGDY